MASLALAFDILARDKGASKTFDKVGDSAERAGKKGHAFGGMVKGAVGLAGAAVAAAGIGKFFADSVAEARESQKVGALTAQVIKTTGGAAKITASQVGDLATAISNKTGIDDEAIQSASNLLLTFTNLRNEAGKGNDVFNQATKIATDMGAALGTEPKAAAIQLGKALNDPVKGITALTRVGVSFSAGQKKQIEGMVKAGDTLGAQKVILAELNKEFGGAAAASSTAGEKASVAFGNLKEQIGTALLPVIDKVAGFLTDKLIPGISVFFDALTGRSELNEFEGGLRTVNNIGVAIYDTVSQKIIPGIKGFISSLRSGNGPVSIFREAVGGVASFFRDKLIPAVQGLVAKILPALKGLIASVSKTLKDHMGVVRFIGTIYKVLGLVITEIVLPLLGEIAKLLLKVLGPAFRAVVAVLDAVVIPAIKLVLKFFLNLVGGIIRGAAQAFGWIPGLGPKLKAAADKFDDFKNQVNGALDGTHSKKVITVMTPGAREANAQLADLLYKTQHLPKSVTIGVTNKLHNIPGRALGGPVTAGMPYIVGEHRPELFVPDSNGTIVPRVPGGAVTLSRESIEALGREIQRRPTVSQISAGSIDRALAAGLR